MSDITLKDWKLSGTSRMTKKQQKMLNAVCECLEQIHWHGRNLTKDGWRHLLSAVSAGQDLMPGWEYELGIDQERSGRCHNDGCSSWRRPVVAKHQSKTSVMVLCRTPRPRPEPERLSITTPAARAADYLGELHAEQ